MDLSEDYEWEFASYDLHPAAKHFQEFQEVYESESLRGRMLVTMGFIEDVLARSIKEYLVDTDPKVMQKFAVRSLGSLSAKLNMAYLLGLIDDREFNMIEKMATIRNIFAHQPLAREDGTTLRNHVRDLARLQNLDQYKENETSNYVNEVWRMTIWSLLTSLINRPERAKERRLKYQPWDLSAP